MADADVVTIPQPYRFDEVNQTPNKPGLYAWYHQIQISTADIQAFAATLGEHEDSAERSEIARQFLLEHIFGSYQEADYSVELAGRLKPEYYGRVTHRPRVSDLLVKLLTEEPSELTTLKTVLHRTIPYFASPIYIGVATKSLRQRLNSHRQLIAQYRELGPTAPMNAEDEDHSFAYEAVCVRRLVPTELLVYAMPLNVSDKLAKGAEYILNRINYPLCGRN